MKKYCITLTYGREASWQWLKIHLLFWYLWPCFKWKYGISNGRQKTIKFWTPRADTEKLGLSDSPEYVDDCPYQVAALYYRNALWLHFLCFTLCVIVRRQTDIARIYGADYDFRKETLEGARKKYHDLYLSGYFS